MRGGCLDALRPEQLVRANAGAQASKSVDADNLAHCVCPPISLVPPLPVVCWLGSHTCSGTLVSACERDQRARPENSIPVPRSGSSHPLVIMTCSSSNRGPHPHFFCATLIARVCFNFANRTATTSGPRKCLLLVCLLAWSGANHGPRWRCGPTNLRSLPSFGQPQEADRFCTLPDKRPNAR